jgi:hypothetical protein
MALALHQEIHPSGIDFDANFIPGRTFVTVTVQCKYGKAVWITAHRNTLHVYIRHRPLIACKTIKCNVPEARVRVANSAKCNQPGSAWAACCAYSGSGGLLRNHRRNADQRRQRQTSTSNTYRRNADCQLQLTWSNVTERVTDSSPIVNVLLTCTAFTVLGTWCLRFLRLPAIIVIKLVHLM